MDTLIKLLSNPELMAMAGIGLSVSLVICLIAIRILWKKLQDTQDKYNNDIKEMYNHYYELGNNLDKTVTTLLKVVKNGRNGSNGC